MTYVGGNGNGYAQLTWFDRDGKNAGAVGEPGNFDGPVLSRDGKHVAVVRYDTQSRGKGNLWLFDLARGNAEHGAFTRFTFDGFMDLHPVFSQDGSRIVFESNREGNANLYQKPTSGVRNEEILLKTDEAKVPSSWSPRRTVSAVHRRGPGSEYEGAPMDTSYGRKPEDSHAFPGDGFNEADAQFSPDGHWIAYQSDESGRDEAYVREFKLDLNGKPEATEKRQISNGGGLFPHWSENGKELFYVSFPDRRNLMSAEIATKPAFQSSPPKPLFQLPAGPGYFAVAPDGKRFLVEVPVAQSGPQQFTVVLNWQAALKK